MEVSLDNHTRLFTEKQIAIAAFFGGPLPIGILLFKNFNRVGKEKAAYLTLVAAIIITMLLFVAFAYTPDSMVSRAPSYFFPILWTVLVYFLYRGFLTKEVVEAMKNGAVKGSNWAVAGLTSLGLVISILLFLGLDLLVPSYEFSGNYMDFQGNRIYYSEEDGTEHKLQSISDQLYRIEYFGTDFLGQVKFERNGDHFLLTIPFNMDYWQSNSEMQLLRNMSEVLKLEFERQIKIVLYDYDLRGEKITKSIDP